MSTRALAGLKKASPRTSKPSGQFGKYPIDTYDNVKVGKNPKDMSDAELTATHDYLQDDPVALKPLDEEADRRYGAK